MGITCKPHHTQHAAHLERRSAIIAGREVVHPVTVSHKETVKAPRVLRLYAFTSWALATLARLFILRGLCVELTCLVCVYRGQHDGAHGVEPRSLVQVVEI